MKSKLLLKSEVNTPFSKRKINPVIVNVLYRTAAENISDAQIQSQIDVLNDDFNATNSDLIRYRVYSLALLLTLESLLF
jgi:hypothetical protein